MAIEQLDNLEPRAFLEKVKDTPYPFEEKVLDITYVAKNMLTGAVFYFLHPIFILRKSYQYFFDDINSQKSEKDLLLTSEKLEEIFSQKNRNEAVKDKFIHIIETTERLSKKMGLGKIAIIISDDEEQSNESIATRNIRAIILRADITDVSKELIEHTIAHELAHIQHGDCLQDRIFEWTVLALQIIVFRHFTIRRALGLWFLIGGLAAHIDKTITIYQERAADKKALQCRNSSQAMIDDYYSDLKLYYTFKHMPALELQKLDPSLKIKEIKKIQSKITPHGNLRTDDTHPPITERLAQALNFKPALKIS